MNFGPLLAIPPGLVAGHYFLLAHGIVHNGRPWSTGKPKR